MWQREWLKMERYGHEDVDLESDLNWNWTVFRFKSGTALWRLFKKFTYSGNSNNETWCQCQPNIAEKKLTSIGIQRPLIWVVWNVRIRKFHTTSISSPPPPSKLWDTPNNRVNFMKKHCLINFKLETEEKKTL